MPKFEKHIFVCCNHRAADHPRGCCNPDQSDALQKHFKQVLAQHGIRGDAVRANKAGCLEQCEHGPTVVVYPEAVWYGGVRHEDVEEIVTSHIVGDRPVERLLIPDECLNTARCSHKPRRS